MAENLGSFLLLAMPPSGEIFLATDAYGTTWLVHPPGAGGPDKINPAAVKPPFRKWLPFTAGIE